MVIVEVVHTLLLFIATGWAALLSLFQQHDFRTVSSFNFPFIFSLLSEPTGSTQSSKLSFILGSLPKPHKFHEVFIMPSSTTTSQLVLSTRYMYMSKVYKIIM